MNEAFVTNKDLGEYKELKVVYDGKDLKKGEDTKTNETLIDKMVYELYHITAEEQKLIEGN